MPHPIHTIIFFLGAIMIFLAVNGIIMTFINDQNLELKVVNFDKKMKRMAHDRSIAGQRKAAILEHFERDTRHLFQQSKDQLVKSSLRIARVRAGRRNDQPNEEQRRS